MRIEKHIERGDSRITFIVDDPTITATSPREAQHRLIHLLGIADSFAVIMMKNGEIHRADFPEASPVGMVRSNPAAP